MIQNSIYYKYLSLLKLVIGIIILLIDYCTINIFEDPIIAISIWLLWCFLFSRWGSFFFFYFVQNLLKSNLSKDLIYSNSYKLSFLFWLYAIINIILIFLWKRNKLWWLIVLCIFIGLLYILFIDLDENSKKPNEQ